MLRLFLLETAQQGRGVLGKGGNTTRWAATGNPFRNALRKAVSRVPARTSHFPSGSYVRITNRS